MRRVMLEGFPFHVTHRGNHKNVVFNTDRDRARYLAALQRHALDFGMVIWGYCLMPNHVHLLVVGCERSSIPKAVGIAHSWFSRRSNVERRVTGHLWANRYFSTPLDETHLWTAVRYVELNPVRAGMVSQAVDYPWSSARAHAGVTEDPILDPARPFPGPIADWAAWLGLGVDEDSVEKLRRNTLSGRPTGSDRFAEEFEARLGRGVAPRKRGPKRGRTGAGHRAATA